MDQQSNQNQNTLSRLFEFTGNCRGKMILSVISAILGVASGMIPYLCVAKLLAAFYAGEATVSFVLWWGLIAVVSYTLKALLKTFSTKKSHESAFSILKNIRIRMTEKMERVPMGVMVNTPSGTFKALLVDTVDKIEKPIAHIIPEMTSNIVTPVVIIVILFVIDWRLALGALATIPVGFIIAMGQMIGYKEKSARFFNARNDMNNALVEYVNGIEVIKAFNQSATSYGKFSKACKWYRDSTLDWWRGCWAFSAVGYAVIAATLVVTLPLGSYLFMTGSIAFAPFITAVILSMGISGPILAAISFADSFANVNESIRRVGDFLDTEELSRPEKRVELDESGYRFSDVSFAYGKEKVLHRVNLKTVPLGMTAIVGPSGGGKSTIAKLMAGFWDPKEGTVTFGGRNIREIPFNQLMEHISYVAQDNFLFNMSIMENIHLGRAGATDEEVKEAARAAGCHDFIMELENGYETTVGNAGGKLSGGERQRITLARAILKNSDIIILDEATAYTDPESEAEIQKAISKLIRGKTLIVIAHHLSTIKTADKIIVVNKGKIEAEGTQESLLKDCPLYQQMWEKHLAAADETEVA